MYICVDSLQKKNSRKRNLKNRKRQISKKYYKGGAPYPNPPFPFIDQDLARNGDATKWLNEYFNKHKISLQNFGVDDADHLRGLLEYFGDEERRHRVLDPEFQRLYNEIKPSYDAYMFPTG